MNVHVQASRDPAPVDVPRRIPSPQLEWVEVDEEIVAWSQQTDSLHRLDRIATLVFQLADGQTPLSQTISDLAEAFGADAEEVEVDVLSCVGRMVNDHLLELSR